MLTTADAQKGFCHGDFMTITYLYYIEEGNDVSLYLIIFIGLVKLVKSSKYPYFMNHFQIHWPNDGKFLKSGHDLHKIFEH